MPPPTPSINILHIPWADLYVREVLATAVLEVDSLVLPPSMMGIWKC